MCGRPRAAGRHQVGLGVHVLAQGGHVDAHRSGAGLLVPVGGMGAEVGVELHPRPGRQQRRTASRGVGDEPPRSESGVQGDGQVVRGQAGEVGAHRRHSERWVDKAGSH